MSRPHELVTAHPHLRGPSVVVPPPGPRSREIAARLGAVECPAFDARRAARAEASGADQAPIAYARAYGDFVEDADGNVFVDMTASFGACILGHAPEPVCARVKEEIDLLPLSLGDVYAREVKVDAVERIAALFPEPGARVLLGSSGADALTAALKTAVLATGKAGVVAFEGAYHGLSYGPLAICGLAPGFRAPFAAQLGSHARFAPYPAAEPDLDASLSAVRAHLAGGDVGAIVVEPVLGRGGCVVPPPGFLAGLRALATEHGALLVADEVWTGRGRSGAMFASLAECVPDVVCLGKGLGAGFPVSACVGRASVMAAWGEHGGTTIHTGTHFGAPPACAAAVATLDLVSAHGLAGRAVEVGGALRMALRLADLSVGGCGLMLGVDLGTGARALAVARGMLARGYIVLTGGRRGEVLTLTPALTVDRELLTGFTEALADVAATT